MKKPNNRKRKFLLKVFKLVLIIRKVVLTDYGMKLIKLMAFSISLLVIYQLLFPYIIYWAFDYELNFSRIPADIGYPIQTMLQLILVLWVFQIGIYTVKSITLYMADSIFGGWKWKGWLHIWEQTTSMTFLSISIIGLLFLSKLSFGNIVGLLDHRQSPFEGISLFMDKNETLIFRTSILSLILFIVIYFHLKLMKYSFKELDKWKNERINQNQMTPKTTL